MVAGTKTVLSVMDEEVTCSVDIVVSGVGYVYVGTNKGGLYKWNIPSATWTLIKRYKGNIQSIVVYSSVLYVGISGGEFSSITLS